MPTHLAELVSDLAARAPGRAVFTFLHRDRAEEVVSAGRLHRDARVLAAVLRSHGVRPGDIVPLAFDHGYDLVAAFWGAVYLGAVPTILPYVSRDARSKSYLEQVRRLVRFTGAPSVVTTLDLTEYLERGLADGACRLIGLGPDAYLGPEDDSEAWRARPPSEPPYIQFSSGTTGSPKGVVLSNRAVLDYEREHAAVSGARADDVMVGWLPLYHDMGFSNQVLLPLAVGHASVMMSPASWLGEPHRLFQAIHRFRGTVTWMPNFAFSYCTRRVRDGQIDGVDLSSWRLLGNASEPVFVRDLEEFARRFAPHGFRPEALTISYGLAEHVAAVTHTPDGRSPAVDWVSQSALAEGRAEPATPGTPESRAIVSCGPPLAGVRLRLLDHDGRELGERRVGDILIQSPCVFDGYFANPAETAAALGDGWLRSGDLGYLAGGELYVCGRRKDLIIVGGRNLHPNHLEQVAAALLGDRCRFAAAFGVPNPRLGTETPVLVCEMRERSDAATELRLRNEIREQVRQTHDVFVADVHLVDGGWIPKTTSGKINRAATRDRWLAEGRAGALPALAEDAPPRAGATPTEGRLLRLWEALFERRGIALDDDFFDLGGDSLLAAQLAIEIEAEFGRSLPPSALLDSPTIAELAGLLDAPERRSAQATLVALRPARARPLRPPFFCVHGLGGGVVDYRPLARALGPEQPFFAIQARGLDGVSPIDTSIEAMARHYIEAVRAEQANGPYHLGGYCFGGVVAFEMARQLRAEAEEVALVAILEGYPPRRRSPGRSRGRDWRHAVDLLRGLPYWLGDYLRLERLAMRARNRRLLRLLRRRLARLAGVRVGLEARDVFDSPPSLPARVQRVLTAHLAAIGNYAPAPYPGPLVLFRTSQRVLRAPSWEMGWGDLTTVSVDVQPVPGSHATILAEPNVRVLAEKLGAFLSSPSERSLPS